MNETSTIQIFFSFVYLLLLWRAYLTWCPTYIPSSRRSQRHVKFSKVFSQHLPRIFMRPDVFGLNIHRVAYRWLHNIFPLSYRFVFFCLRERHLRKVNDIFGMRIHRLEADFCLSKRLDFMWTSFAKLSRRFVEVDGTGMVVETMLSPLNVKRNIIKCFR